MTAPQPPSMGVPHLYEVIEKLSRSESRSGSQSRSGSESRSGSPSPFPELLRTVVSAGGGRFGHREHVHLTWLAVREHGAQAAAGLVGDGLRSVTALLGVEQKYNVTMTRAWVELVAHHIGETAGDGGTEDFEEFEEVEDFEDFADRNPELLDKRLLTRFYRPATLASERARTDWVEPDLAPFPWQ